jgi:hypothetical protein
MMLCLTLLLIIVSANFCSKTPIRRHTVADTEGSYSGFFNVVENAAGELPLLPNICLASNTQAPHRSPIQKERHPQSQ